MQQLLWTMTSFLFCYSLSAQTDPSFTRFKGNYYKMPGGKIALNHKGYGKDIYNYDSLGTVTYDSINFPDTFNDEDFPGTTLNKGLCMVLFSNMTIHQDGCYEFELISDDGSRLWIADKHIINNDGNHQFRAKRDSVFIQKGNYQVKLWYMQLFPNKYGFVFKAKSVREFCDKGISPTQKSFSLNTQVLFDYDSSELTSAGENSLDSLVTKLNAHSFDQMIITGHTDNRGAGAYNLILSQSRANAVRHYLESLNEFTEVSFKSIGVGEQRPIAKNVTEEGREKNRRVEIEIRSGN